VKSVVVFDRVLPLPDDEHVRKMNKEPKVYTVTQVTRLIKSALEREFGEIWVEGELSNVRRPSSGHCYFTIKDESAEISAVLFRGAQRNLAFQPKDGVLVRVFGEVTVYERRGQYQVIVRRIEEWGKGNLQARFEALKEKLRGEGLFDEDRKKPLPLLPQHVGIVTSPTGAAIRDILNVTSRRFPNLHLVIAPAAVQGDAAAGEIAAAIELLNARGGLDAMIVGRGGGSLEDLWCFNEEVVARAVAASRIPVISAVGHETDFTISDFVADLRAPTPSAAAELVVGRKDALEGMLAERSRALAHALREVALRARNRLLGAGSSYVFREPGNLVRQHRQGLVTLRVRMEHGLRGRLRDGQQRIDDMAMRALHHVRLRQNAGRQDLRRLGSHLGALNPLAVLERGYSITMDGEGRVVGSSADVSVGQHLRTRVGRGEIESEVTATTGTPEEAGT